MKILSFKVCFGEFEKVVGLYSNSPKNFKKMKKDTLIFLSNVLIDNGYFKNRKEIGKKLKGELKKLYTKTFILEVEDLKFMIERYEVNAMTCNSVKFEKEEKEVRRPNVMSPIIPTFKSHGVEDFDTPINALPLSPLYTKK